MPQSLARIIVHIIYSTKERWPFLTLEVRPTLWAYMSGILDECDSKAILIGGAKDHAHVLCMLSKTPPPCRVVEELKTGSSKWIKEQGAQFGKFQWQGGYGMFSVSQSNVDAVCQYIAAQEEHHKAVSFQDEFRAFLAKHQVAYDEQYVWG